MMEAKSQEFEKKLNKIIDKLKNVEDSIKEINKNTIYLNDKLEVLTKEMDQFKKISEKKDKDLLELKKNNDFLLAENRCMKEEINMIRLSTEDILYSNHINELDLVGIGNYKTEEIQEKIINAGKKWKINITKNDITEIQEKNMKNKNDKFYRIKFKQQKLKEDFHTAAKKAKTKAEDLNIDDKKKRIFFNDILPPYSKKLLYLAKTLKTELNWKFIWSKNGRILVRKDEHSPAITIKSVTDIEILKGKSNDQSK